MLWQLAKFVHGLEQRRRAGGAGTAARALAGAGSEELFARFGLQHGEEVCIACSAGCWARGEMARNFAGFAPAARLAGCTFVAAKLTRNYHAFISNFCIWAVQ